MPFPADDRYFRLTFANMPRMAGLLREFLPTKLVACLNLDKLRRIHEQHLQQNLSERRDDLNLTCPVLGPCGTIHIRILVEHKSIHDPGLWRQLLNSLLAEWDESGMAPALPIVVYTGTTPFRIESPQTLFQNLVSPLLACQIHFPIFAIDLQSCPETRIWESPHLDAVSRIALSIMKLAQRRDLEISTLRALLQKFLPDVPKLRQRRLLWAAISYLQYKSLIPIETLSTLGSDMPL
ncbi:MAG TPA: Rpn family recombination-promoting nuclease/putative transposase, partial [Fibrobacteraceae bacterium]|nr:Rpn family recombination-promoting nuclease/putative transposase [Fibrobacteraceae bacterium]